MNVSNIPVELINMLLNFAENLNISDKDAFVGRVLKRLAGIVDEYPETIFWTVTGYVIGKVIDNILTIPIVEIPITGGIADGICSLVGFVHGFNKDMESRNLDGRIRIVISEEINRARKA